MACGWLIVIGMLSVCRLLKLELARLVVGPMPFDVGVDALATEFSDAVT
jgi:hypothetical protein